MSQFTYAQEETSTTLETWANFRFDLKTLASWDYKNVEKIREAKSLNSSCSNADNETCKKISAEWEEFPVYARYKEDKKTIYYYTTAAKIYLNPSSAQMFSSFNKLSEIVMTKFDTSKVTDMSSMFKDCKSLTGLDVSNFVTTNVTDMSNMFNGYKWTNLDLSSFDTSNVTNMNWMFNGYSWNVLDVSSFDTSKVTNMSNMFYGCNHLTTLDVSKFDTKNVTNMNNMFYGCTNIEELDLTLFNTANVTKMDSMFFDCNKLATIYVSNLFVLDNVTSSTNMFKKDTSLVWWNGTPYTWTYVTWSYAVIDNEEHPWYFSLKDKESIFLPWEKFNVKIKSIANWTGMSVKGTDNKITSIKRSYQSPSTENVEIISILWAKNPIYAWYDNWTIFYYTDSERIYMNPDSKSMFQWLSVLNDIDFENVYTNNVVSMENMFNGCESLENLDLQNFNTSKVTTMKSMFYNCKWLKNLNLEKFNTSNVEHMDNMFFGCESLETLDLENFDTRKVTNMTSMFQLCKSLQTLDLENFDTKEVLYMSKTFSSCTSLKTLNISSFDTSKVTNMNSLFYDMSNIETIYASEKFVTTALSWWKDGKTKPANNMFSGDIKLIWWNGTVYNSSMVESGYAKIDNQTQSWYFTDILDKKYYITYNLDGWTISWEKTIYTQRDSFSLQIPTREWYNFIWWTWSNWETLKIEVTIPEWTKWNLEYTANREKIEEKSNSDNNYSWWGWGRKTATKTDTKTDETKAGENKQEKNKIENSENEEKLNIPERTQEELQKVLDDWLTQEFHDAYDFGYHYWITTMPSAKDADMNGPLTRIAMAKMLSNYAINVLWKKPENKPAPNFPDVDKKMNEDYGWAVDLAFQLWIMWINVERFRPYDLVPRWEFGTALSRMLFGVADGEREYYETHLNKLKEEGIITNDNPNLQELRGYVMIMLKRSVNK